MFFKVGGEWARSKISKNCPHCWWVHPNNLYFTNFDSNTFFHAEIFILKVDRTYLYVNFYLYLYFISGHRPLCKIVNLAEGQAKK